MNKEKAYLVRVVVVVMIGCCFDDADTRSLVDDDTLVAVFNVVSFVLSLSLEDGDGVFDDQVLFPC